MKRSAIIIFLMVVWGAVSAFAASFANEDLHYVITYKWGMIRKDAGEATLSLRNRGSHYDISLVARTKPWADSFYSVRDTLLGKIRSHDLRPVSYHKITHEKGKYGKDVIKYSYEANRVKGHCTRYREKKGKVSSSSVELSATGEVYDMLSVFYYLRNIDYNTLTSGRAIRSTVFSGKKSETITIKCLGKEQIKLRDKSRREAYHIQFKFTSGGGKKSSDDIDAWISTDSRHIPLYMVGRLPIGEVRAYYVP